MAEGRVVKVLERAGDLLLGRRVEPEVEVPDGITIREGRWIPWIGGWLGRMRSPAAAVTLRRTIVVHPRSRLSRRLLAHEMTHVRQWAEDPLFPLRYTAETLRRGYRANRYEQEAREAEVFLEAEIPLPKRQA